MKYVIGAVIGVLIYHYYPAEVKDIADKAGGIVHNSAVKAAELTRQ